MKNLNVYLFFKFLLIVIIFYLFFNPQVFQIEGFISNDSNGIIICRGLLICMALKLVSDMVDELIKKR